jgi:Rap1a immunity proteins
VSSRLVLPGTLPRIVSTSDRNQIRITCPSILLLHNRTACKLYSAAAGVFIAALTASAARADGPDISAQRLLASWQDGDPNIRMVAEVIASAFASGFSWGGDTARNHAYCAPADLKGRQIMSAFEEFLRDNPKMADEPYGAAMAATLSKSFPCGAQ